MDLNYFSPDELPNRSIAELQELTVSDLAILAEQHQQAPAVFLIQNTNNSGVASLATYKSLHWLLARGHKFKIVGLPSGVVAAKQQVNIDDLASELSKVEKVEPETQIVKASESITVSNSNKSKTTKTKKDAGRKTS